MTSWLHIVGKQYGKERFVNETKRIGIQRAVSMQVLSKMEFGDTVYLGTYHKSPTRKKVIVFGYFKIESISVENTEETNHIFRGLTRTINGIETVHYERQCGSYDITSVYSITDKTLHDFYEQLKDKHARVLIGARKNKLIEIPEITIRGAVFFRGFRKIKPLIAEPMTTEEIDRLLNQLDNYQLS
jgi:predicted TIM-barrel fold metal-dependent hydrolase